jgi:hypothetical protein
MKKECVIMAVVLGMFQTTGWAGQFGPPTPITEEGRVNLGIGYSSGSTKWEPENRDWLESKIEQNHAYLEGAYGLMKNVEGYLRLGVADAKAKNAFLFDSLRDFEDSDKPFGTVGVKGILYSDHAFTWGPFIQGSLYSTYEDKRSGTMSGTPVTAEIKIKNPWEVNLGIAVQTNIGENTLYGGPFLYKTRAEMEGEAGTFGIGSSGSTFYEEKDVFGGFLGLRFLFGNGFNGGIEAQYRSRGSVGISLGKSF